MPFKSEKQRKWMWANDPEMAKKWEKKEKKMKKEQRVKELIKKMVREELAELDEAKERNYKEEYKKYGSSKKAKKYRAELNAYNRKKGTYGNGDGKDASHKGGKIVGFEAESKNRGRAEKSRLKKEGKLKEAYRSQSIFFDKKDKSKLEKLLKKHKGKFPFNPPGEPVVNWSGPKDRGSKGLEWSGIPKMNYNKAIEFFIKNKINVREGKLKEGKGVDKVLDMANNNSFGKLAGKTVDAMSANLFKQVYEKSGSTAKAKIDKMNEKQIYGLMIKIWNKFGKQVKL